MKQEGEEGTENDDQTLHTLRKGLPRFVVFIMWEEVLGPSGAADMATGGQEIGCGKEDEKRKKEKKSGEAREEEWAEEDSEGGNIFGSVAHHDLTGISHQGSPASCPS